MANNIQRFPGERRGPFLGDTSKGRNTFGPSAQIQSDDSADPAEAEAVRGV